MSQLSAGDATTFNQEISFRLSDYAGDFPYVPSAIDKATIARIRERTVVVADALHLDTER